MNKEIRGVDLARRPLAETCLEGKRPYRLSRESRAIQQRQACRFFSSCFFFRNLFYVVFIL
jgi:hypothetical protein